METELAMSTHGYSGVANTALGAVEQAIATVSGSFNQICFALRNFAGDRSFVQWRLVLQTQGTTDWLWQYAAICV
ncbi:hypothetical protein XI04_03145 [Bradyrhizobium sp. CCBAU 11430]|nr:hypothetical protein [Bradyrhizobium sp. CCBAU 11430]